MNNRLRRKEKLFGWRGIFTNQTLFQQKGWVVGTLAGLPRLWGRWLWGRW